jgi:uncharacterized protein YkwD
MDYKVERGDTLSALAKRYGTTVDAIMDANKGHIKDRNLIITGDTITIPTKDAKDGAAKGQPDAPKPDPAPKADAKDGADTLGAGSVPAAGGAAVQEPATEQILYQHVMPAGSEAQPVIQAQASYEDAYEQRVVDLVNQIRSSYGLSQLSYDYRLDLGAERHTAHMATVGQMAHEGIGDGTPQERMFDAGWQWAWGENAAVGQTSPEQVVNEWMASPGHRANILNPNFRFLSVGYGVAQDGRPYWTQEFGEGS